jgi:hypothetical protein
VTIDCVEAASGTTTNPALDEESDGEAGDADLVVNARDFTMPEFLGWVEVWLRAKGFAVTELVHAPLSDFASTHPHADFLIRLVEPPSRDL